MTPEQRAAAEKLDAARARHLAKLSPGRNPSTGVHAPDDPIADAIRQKMLGTSTPVAGTEGEQGTETRRINPRHPQRPWWDPLTAADYRAAGHRVEEQGHP